MSTALPHLITACQSRQALDSATDTGKRYVLDLAGTLTEEAFGTCDAPPPRLRPNQTGLRYGPVVCELFRMLFV